MKNTTSLLQIYKVKFIFNLLTLFQCNTPAIFLTHNVWKEFSTGNIEKALQNVTLNVKLEMLLV